MSDAPERIYLDGDVEAGDGMFPRCFENPKYASKPQVEYIRADLATTAPAVDPMSDPRVVALVDLLKEARNDIETYVDADWPENLRAQYPSYQSKWDRDMELCRRIDAALAAIEKGQTDE